MQLLLGSDSGSDVHVLSRTPNPQLLIVSITCYFIPYMLTVSGRVTYLLIVINDSTLLYSTT